MGGAGSYPLCLSRPSVSAPIAVASLRLQRHRGAHPADRGDDRRRLSHMQAKDPHPYKVDLFT